MKKEKSVDVFNLNGESEKPHKENTNIRTLEKTNLEIQVNTNHARTSFHCIEERKKERKDDLSLLSDDKDDNEEECTSTI